ncbi:MAG: TasA family protein [Ilumatobacter sp.]
MTITDTPTSNSWAPPTPTPPVGPDPSATPNLVFKAAAFVAVLAAAAATFTIASLALFTDTASVDDNVFTTGNVDISTTPTTAAFTVPAIAPGDEVVETITVTNSGSLDLRYAVTSRTTEDTLASELDFSIRVGVTDCSIANWDATGTPLYTAGILGTDTTDPTPAHVLFGSVAQGEQAGDRELRGSASAVTAVPTSEMLCMHVTLPLAGSTNASQNLSTTATFEFVAEQIKNNP